MSRKTTAILLDPFENAILVEYEVTTEDDDGATSTVSKETRVRLKQIKADTNLDKLARGIIDKCKYISDKKFETVLELVHDLKRRQFQADDDEEDDNRGGDVSLDQIDEYMEQLYGGEDDLKDKIKASGAILTLCKDVANLEPLIQNTILMSALTRVLADDFKRSSDLSFNLCRVFLSFSNFMEMHGLLANYKVGAMTMKVVELELKRSDLRNEEKQNGQKEPVELSSRDRVANRRQDKILFVALHLLINLAEDVSIEKKMVKKNLVKMLTDSLSRRTPDTLMLILTFLRKLSIFETNMRTMSGNDTNTIYYLSKFLPCSHDKITLTCLRLLFNLSFDKGCREKMVEVGLLPKLVDLLKKAPFRAKTIRVLYHLSADDSSKFLFSKTEAIPIIMQLIINFPQDTVAKELAALAINVSLDSACAEQMCEHRGLTHLMGRVGDFGDVLLSKVVRNISQWTFSEQRMITHITAEVERLQAGGRDEDLPKIPQYVQRRLWGEHVGHIFKLAMDCESQEQNLLVELMGTVGNFTEQDLPKGTKWHTLMKDYGLCGFIGKLLVPGMSQNDVVLESVILCGQMCCDGKSSLMIASSSLIRSLHELWQDKSDDSEIVLQLLTCYHRFLHFEETREELLYSTEAMADISECVGRKHRGTREIAEKCLEMILEHDRNEDGEIGELGSQVRRRRFLAHNKEWIAEHGQAEEDDGGRVYRHGAYDDSDDELNLGGGNKAYDSESSSDGDDGEGGHMFRSNGQKINVDTSGLSSGVEDSQDSRGEYDGGWGQ